MSKQIFYYLDASITPPGWYGSDGQDLSANNPQAINWREFAEVQYQLTDGPPDFDAAGTLTNPYTGFTGATHTNATTIDNNFIKYQSSLLKTTLTAATPVSAIQQTAASTPRLLGTLYFVNSSGESETVNYNGFTDDGGGLYTFTTADVDFTVADYTPTYNFAIDDTARVYEVPIILSANNSSDPDNGLYGGELDADNPVYEALVGNSDDITGCRIELNIYEAGRPVFVARMNFDCENRMATDFTSPLPPQADYTVLDSRYWQLDLSTYTVVSSLAGTELLPVRDGSSSKYATMLQIGTYVTNLIGAAVILQGDWNADTNTPDISTTTTAGYAWRVSVAGSTTLGSISSWAVGDLAVKTASSWLKIDNEDIAAVWGNISGTLSNQTDLQSALDAKENSLGFTPENIANKATDFLTVNDTKYPSVEAVYEELQKRQEAGTVWFQPPELSVNGGDNTLFDISSGVGIIFNYDTGTPTYTPVTYAGASGVSTTYLASTPSSNVTIDSTGTLKQYNSLPNNTLRREELYVGALLHVNLTNLNGVQNEPVVGYDDSQTIRDLALSIGAINTAGNLFSANGANLNINKSSGSFFRIYGNYSTSKKDPNTVASTSLTPAGFLTGYYNGSIWVYSTSETSTVPVTQYNNVASGLVAVSPNKFIIHSIYIFPGTDQVILHYGQTQYDTMDDATAGLSDPVTIDNNLKDASLRCRLIVQTNATNLSDTGEAKFVNTDKFGQLAGGGVGGGTGANTFLDHTDTPASYSGSGGFFLKVNSGATAVEFVNVTVGDFSGPGSSTDNAIVRFDGTGGKTGQNSTVTITDVGKMTFPDISTTGVLNITERSTVPSAPASGDIYLDDGTNTASGNPGWRRYTGAGWEDIGATAGGSGLLIAEDSGYGLNNGSTGRGTVGNGAVSLEYSSSGSTYGATGSYSFCGGANNTASNTQTVVVGGINNTNSSEYSFIGGGQNNTISGGTNSFIGGGQNNTITGFYSGIISGQYLITSSNNQTVVGKYNVEDTSDLYIIVAGNGTAPAARSNAMTLTWSGDIWVDRSLEITEQSSTPTTPATGRQKLYPKTDGLWYKLDDAGNPYPIDMAFPLRTYHAADSDQDWNESKWTNVGSNRPTIDYDTYDFPVWAFDYETAEGGGLFSTGRIPSGATNLLIKLELAPQTPGASGSNFKFKADFVRLRNNAAATSIETEALTETAFQGTGFTFVTFTLTLASFLTTAVVADDELVFLLYPDTGASSPKQTDWQVKSVEIGVL